jgi:hypothetical protein
MAFNPGVYQRLDMVCGNGDGLVRDCGIEGHITMEAGGIGNKSEEGGVRSERVFERHNNRGGGGAGSGVSGVGVPVFS